ncbi:hypothetical protein ACIXLL_002783 [Staphylococcus aureus]
MGLKQSIVIKSQFGSSTPGRYIEEYRFCCKVKLIYKVMQKQ